MADNPSVEPMRELRVWLRDSDYRALKAHADRQAVSQSEAVRQAVSKYLGEDAAGQSAPWLGDMIDAVLSKYFQGFPQVLERLVESAFEQRSWAQSSFLKLLEVAGDKDTKSQDARLEKIVGQIQNAATQKADQFFQSLGQPDELIEPPEPVGDDAAE